MEAITLAAARHSGLSRVALDYSIMMKRLVDQAKETGFTAGNWAPLAAYVDSAAFRRVGNFKEVMNWDEYVTFLTGWAKSSEWEGSFRRVTESGNIVLLELEERTTTGGHSSVVNSVSVYAFNGAGKIRHLDIYLQMAMPDPEMLASYANVDMTG